MQFPQSFNRGTNGGPPIIGQTKEVPCVQFQIQVTPELMSALGEYAKMTGLDGVSLMNYALTRGLTAIKQDVLNAQAEAELSDDPEDEGTPQE